MNSLLSFLTFVLAVAAAFERSTLRFGRAARAYNEDEPKPKDVADDLLRTFLHPEKIETVASELRGGAIAEEHHDDAEAAGGGAEDVSETEDVSEKEDVASAEDAVSGETEAACDTAFSEEPAAEIVDLRREADVPETTTPEAGASDGDVQGALNVRGGADGAEADAAPAEDAVSVEAVPELTEADGEVAESAETGAADDMTEKLDVRGGATDAEAPTEPAPEAAASEPIAPREEPTSGADELTSGADVPTEAKETAAEAAAESTGGADVPSASAAEPSEREQIDASAGVDVQAEATTTTTTVPETATTPTSDGPRSGLDVRGGACVSSEAAEEPAIAEEPANAWRFAPKPKRFSGVIDSRPMSNKKPKSHGIVTNTVAGHFDMLSANVFSQI